MNPWSLTVSELLVWGIVLHLIADWPLQNDWMASNKAKRLYYKNGDGIFHNGERGTYTPWYVRHPAAYIHALIHTVCLSCVFGWAAVLLGTVHLIIDTRVPVVWWSKLIKQTQPKNLTYDIGLEVRFWTDQVFHIVCIAVAAILVA